MAEATAKKSRGLLRTSTPREASRLSRFVTCLAPVDSSAFARSHLLLAGI